MKAWVVFAVTVGLIGLTGVFLSLAGRDHRLGEPGLTIVDEPLADKDGKVLVTQSVRMPEQLSGYQSQQGTLDPTEVSKLPKDTTFGRRMYQSKDGFTVALAAVVMGTDRTSIHKPQYCLQGQGWKIVKTEEMSVDIPGAQPFRLPVMKVTVSIQQRLRDGKEVEVSGLYVYWFVEEKKITRDHYQRMWWMAKDLLARGTLQRWAYVSCFALCTPGSEPAAYERLESFLAAAVPQLHRPGIEPPPGD